MIQVGKLKLLSGYCADACSFYIHLFLKKVSFFEGLDFTTKSEINISILKYVFYNLLKLSVDHIA